MTLPQDQYGDPSKWLERQQEREQHQKIKSGRQLCDGCVHKANVWGVEYCIEDHTKAGKANMVRCNYFKGAANV